MSDKDPRLVAHVLFLGGYHHNQFCPVTIRDPSFPQEIRYPRVLKFPILPALDIDNLKPEKFTEPAPYKTETYYLHWLAHPKILHKLPIYTLNPDRPSQSEAEEAFEILKSQLGRGLQSYGL